MAVDTTVDAIEAAKKADRAAREAKNTAKNAAKKAENIARAEADKGVKRPTDRTIERRILESGDKVKIAKLMKKYGVIDHKAKLAGVDKDAYFATMSHNKVKGDSLYKAEAHTSKAYISDKKLDVVDCFNPNADGARSAEVKDSLRPLSVAELERLGKKSHKSRPYKLDGKKVPASITEKAKMDKAGEFPAHQAKVLNKYVPDSVEKFKLDNEMTEIEVKIAKMLAEQEALLNKK